MQRHHHHQMEAKMQRWRPVWPPREPGLPACLKVFVWRSWTATKNRRKLTKETRVKTWSCFQFSGAVHQLFLFSSALHYGRGSWLASHGSDMVSGTTLDTNININDTVNQWILETMFYWQMTPNLVFIISCLVFLLLEFWQFPASTIKRPLKPELSGWLGQHVGSKLPWAASN